MIMCMDFLSKYHTTMECHKNEVVFRKLGEPEVIFRGNRKILPTCMFSTVKARKLLNKGCTLYLAPVVVSREKKMEQKGIHVVQEYLDIFSEERS